jgi:phosphatidylserine synthase 2
VNILKSKYFNSNQAYSFRKIQNIHTYKEKLERGLQQFSPHSWTKFEWGLTKTFSRFVAIVALIILETIAELNAFYLKTLLWIPVSSNLNIYRLLLLFFISLPAVREYYDFLTSNLN